MIAFQGYVIGKTVYIDPDKVLAAWPNESSTAAEPQTTLCVSTAGGTTEWIVREPCEEVVATLERSKKMELVDGSATDIGLFGTDAFCLGRIWEAVYAQTSWPGDVAHSPENATFNSPDAALRRILWAFRTHHQERAGHRSFLRSLEQARAGE